VVPVLAKGSGLGIGTGAWVGKYGTVLHILFQAPANCGPEKDEPSVKLD